MLARKFAWPAEDIPEGIRRIQGMARTVTPAVQLEVIKEDPDDDRVLECAMSAGADYIITRDKDLLRLRNYAGIRIIEDEEFMEIVRGEQRAR